MTPRIPVWTWRDAIRKTEAPPLTKLLCYTISLYVSDVGRGAWPAVKTLLADTGMSNKTFTEHLKKAVELGLLATTREKGKDGRLKSYVYHPRFPDFASLPTEEELRGGGLLVKELHLASTGVIATSGPGVIRGRNPGVKSTSQENYQKRTFNKGYSASPEKKASPSGVHDTSEKLHDYTARMIREGKLPANFAMAAKD